MRNFPSYPPLDRSVETEAAPRLAISIDVIVRSLQDSLSEISVELIPIHDRLITVRRKLVTLAAKEGSHRAELKPLAEELRKIDSCVHSVLQRHLD